SQSDICNSDTHLKYNTLTLQPPAASTCTKSDPSQECDSPTCLYSSFKEKNTCRSVGDQQTLHEYDFVYSFMK
ncbi:hypothetical protein PMAYCL1PPCAC_22296, partial [Pristionchus mayeri]